MPFLRDRPQDWELRVPGNAPCLPELSQISFPSNANGVEGFGLNDSSYCVWQPVRAWSHVDVSLAFELGDGSGESLFLADLLQLDQRLV